MTNSPRWVNAVMEIRVPLDVPVDAAEREKLEAAAKALEGVDLPRDAVATIGFETVEDGEPIALP